jgi:hypothetical protein
MGIIEHTNRLLHLNRDNNMAENTTKKPEVDQGEKDTKKLIESHMAVLKHKLGRAPTVDEIAKAVTEAGTSQESVPAIEPSAEETTAEPKVLKLKVYYGMGSKKTDKGDVKEPDPNKVLFYEHGDGRCFDCSSQAWSDQKPPMLDHLPSRPLMFDSKNTDIIRAIANGVLDDEDFTELDKSGALNDDSRKVYNLQKKAREIAFNLEKSDEIETDGEEPVETTVNVEEAASVKPKQGVDVVKDFMDTAGVQQSIAAIEENFGQDGADLFAEIMKAALADVDEKTRMLVREEMDACLAPVLDAIEALAQHIGLQIDLSQPEDIGEGEAMTDEYHDDDDQKEMDDMQLDGEDEEPSEDEDLTNAEDYDTFD